MNTWIVGNQPIGHWKRSYAEDQIQTNSKGHRVTGEMTFFMKGRIMAGQANIENNTSGATDFRWLTKDEVKPLVTRGYWSAIQDILPER
jgi:large subunit ribosomal protein L46